MPTYFTDEDGNYAAERTRSRASVVFLSNELKPAQVTERLGLSPDRSWLQGDTRPGGQRQPHHGWMIESRIREDRPPEEHIADLIERLARFAPGLAELARDPAIVSAQFRLYRHGENWNPGLSLSPELIRGLDALGLGFDADLYVSTDEIAPLPNVHSGRPPKHPH
jgi:hypothetical protein